MKTYNWEITTGCGNLGGGCESCPSLWEAKANYGVEGHKFEHGYGIQLHPERLFWPRTIVNHSLISVSVGSDLFHEDVPTDFIRKVFSVMRDTPHSYDLVTKRAERLGELAGQLKWPGNLSVGVTVESGEYAWRIEHLKKVPVATRFISMVPLLGPMGELDLEGIAYVGAMKENWGLKRPFDERWLGDVYRQCEEQGVAVLDNFLMYSESVGV